MNGDKKVKNPIIALFLSALMPGLGQIYNSQYSKGLFFVGFNMVINFLLRDPFFKVVNSSGIVDRPTLVIFFGYSIAGLIFWIYAMFDAKRFADELNSKQV